MAPLLWGEGWWRRQERRGGDGRRGRERERVEEGGALLRWGREAPLRREEGGVRLRESEVRMEVRVCCARGIYTRNPLLGLDGLCRLVFTEADLIACPPP